MADDDALITKAAEAVRHALKTRTWTDPYSGRGFGLSEDQIAAEAVETVAREWQYGGWTILTAPPPAGAVPSLALGQRVTDWLRARAEALGATESAREGENGGLGGREAERGRGDDSGGAG